MKTILIIYAIIESLLIIWWILAMIKATPTWNYPANRKFINNWNEGGNWVFALTFALAAILTAMVVKILVWIKLFELL